MNLKRRTFLRVLGGSVVMMGVASRPTWAGQLPQDAIAQNSTPYTLPPLPYAYDALEPYIDARTMQFHHDKHHAAYVNNLNAALNQHPEIANQSLSALLKDLNKVPEDIRTTIRNNGGGHLNHSLFWEIMTPSGGGEPTGAIATTINQTFGDFKTFQEQFNETGAKRFGSGWVWLVLTPNQQLQILSTPNQDSPLMAGNTPIMGNDVWEHAYYLNYQNRRADYLKAWWNVLNWDKINQRFEQAQRL